MRVPEGRCIVRDYETGFRLPGEPSWALRVESFKEYTTGAVRANFDARQVWHPDANGPFTVYVEAVK